MTGRPHRSLDREAAARWSDPWPPRLFASRTAGPQDQPFPDAGLLRRGTADPADPRYDSRTAWAATGQTIEPRLPYQAIGVADPSSLTAYRPLEDGSIATEDFERIAISVAVGDVIQHTAGYGWEPWQQVEWRER